MYSLAFVEYFVAPSFDDFTILKNELGLPWTVYIGALGIPGQTAYTGWKEFSDAQKGETVFVTTGAGP